MLGGAAAYILSAHGASVTLSGMNERPVIYGPDGFPVGSTAELAEQIADMGYTEAQEALYLLEDQLLSRQGLFAAEDRDWRGLSIGAQDQDRDALDWESVQRASELAYRYWIHNPIIHQGVNVTSEYVFGRGINITAEDEMLRDQARDLWSKPDMQRIITGGNGLQNLCSILQVYGNVFLGLKPMPADDDRVRIIEMSTMHRVMVDEWGEPMMWLRSYRDSMMNHEAKREWVPSLQYYERDMTPEKGYNFPLNRSFAIQHIKMGSLVGVLGLPTFWSGIAWAKAYKESLEDFAVVQRALRTFAWRATGSSFDGVQNIKSAVQDGYRKAETSAYGTGRVIAMPSGDSQFAPIRTANYQTPADGSRRLLLMACSAFGLPETYFGDVSVGTYATASSMERPVELRMKAIQSMFGAELEKMLSFLLNADMDNEKGINIEFPSILEHDAGPFMQAVKTADALSYPVMTPQMLAAKALETLGFEDVEDAVAKMEEEGMFEQTRQEETLKLQQEYAPDPMMGGGPPGAKKLGKDYQRADRPKGQGMPRPDRGKMPSRSPARSTNGRK